MKVSFKLNQVIKKQNSIQKEIGIKKKVNLIDHIINRVFCHIKCSLTRIYNLFLLSLKNKEDASTLIAEKDSLNSEKERLTALEKEKEESLKTTIATIGNIVHHSVPTSLDEADNEIIRQWEPPADAEGGDGGRKPV